MIKENQELHNGLWIDHYLTYKHEIVGIAADETDLQELSTIQRWLEENSSALKAFVAGISIRLFTQRATAISSADIFSLPYPNGGSLDLSYNEEILIDDVIVFLRDLVRIGAQSVALQTSANDDSSLTDYTEVFCTQLNTVYPRSQVQALQSFSWPGVICQPFVFGKGEIDWTGAEGLRDKLDALLLEKQDRSLRVTRIARIYDSNFVFLLKPDRLRFWLRSVALRDADDVLSDLRSSGL